MKKQIFILFCFICISVLFANCSQIQIIPGVGVGKYKLDSHENEYFTNIEDRIKLAENGVLFSGEKGIIHTIVTTSTKYSTIEGVRVGDNINKIKNFPEALLNEKLQLEKGNSTIPTDNNVLVFPGIVYIVKDNIIHAIMVVKD